MRNTTLLLILMLGVARAHAQSPPDTLAAQRQAAADDPSQFITRVELFNEFQRYENGIDLNRTVLRTTWKVGKRFSTRLDVPYVQNSFSHPAGYAKAGLGDISFRLLGYQLLAAKRAALTVSMEVSLNTAASPLLGTGKNMLIPLVTYSRASANKRTIMAAAYQQAFSVWGEEDRADLYFSKLQTIVLHFWSRKSWSVLAPEFYADHMKGGLSMNVLGRQAFAPSPRINVWVQAGVGVFGDFITRYDWNAEVGGRYFILRKGPSRAKKTKG